MVNSSNDDNIQKDDSDKNTPVYTYLFKKSQSLCTHFILSNYTVYLFLYLCLLFHCCCIDS